MPPSMTTTGERAGIGAPSRNGARLAPRSRERSVPLAVLGVLLCFLGALVFGALHLRLDHRVAVLAIAKPIAAGQVIHAEDLRVARVAPGSLATVAASDRGSVV